MFGTTREIQGEVYSFGANWKEGETTAINIEFPTNNV